MYVGKESLKEDIAVIKGSINYLFSVIININIHAVDGSERKHLIYNKVEVKPGLHRIGVEYTLISNSIRISTNVDFLINVEARHKYKIQEENLFLVVIDTTSGMVVASHSPNQYTTFSLCPI